MRELKFRAWCSSEKIMEYNIFLSEFGKPMRLSDRAYIDDDEITIVMKYTRLTDDNVVVMQHIGIKDKRGVEIYEGDIVTLHQFLFDGQEIESTLFGVVTYLSDIAAFAIERIRNKFYEETTGYDPGEGTSAICEFYGMHEMSFQVIGNIHETPELLQE